MPTLKFIIELLSAFLVPIIAGITVYIAYRQYITDRQRLKFELYDKRFEVYLSVRTLISEIVSKANIELERSLQFLKDTKEAEFLFDEDILDYIQQVYRKSLELQKVTKLLERPGDGEQRSKLVDDHIELLEWFGVQAESSIKKFGKYLSLRNLS